jgi:putative peptide maturation dehydrogenase
MRIRRCAVLFLEPREALSFDLDSLMAGGDGLRRERSWLALAPHLGTEVEVDANERELLGAVSPSAWIDVETMPQHSRVARERLLEQGLLLAEGEHFGNLARDETLRAAHWHPLAAALHAFTRWQDVDTVQNMRDSGTETAVGLRDKLGAPPAEAASHLPTSQQLPLPRSVPTDFDRLMARRATCRNFDPARPLPQVLFAQMLERVFAAKAEVRVNSDTAFLKKSSPSGGGLHPIEAYLIVQHVEGIAPGLYHYQASEHALEPLPAPALPLPEFIMQAVAQQHWFSDAHVLVLLAPRFDRTFWKYRNHAKGYRVVALEAGHLSQTLYLSATDAGLGAFITGAINEVQLEQAFGLDHLHQGVLAICGFGYRAKHMVTTELDPTGEVWTN